MVDFEFLFKGMNLINYFWLQGQQIISCKGVFYVFEIA